MGAQSVRPARVFFLFGRRRPSLAHQTATSIPNATGVAQSGPIVEAKPQRVGAIRVQPPFTVIGKSSETCSGSDAE